MYKGYFLVKPSDFIRYGDVDLNGNYDYTPCKDFQVEEPRENYLVFEVKYFEFEDGEIEYAKTCREVITGEKFAIKVNKKKGKNKSSKNNTIALISERVGLFTKPLLASSIDVIPSRVSGLFNYWIDNPEHKVNYCTQLKNMFEEAESYKYDYDHSVYGPSSELTRQMRRTYRKVNV